MQYSCHKSCYSKCHDGISLSQSSRIFLGLVHIRDQYHFNKNKIDSINTGTLLRHYFRRPHFRHLSYLCFCDKTEKVNKEKCQYCTTRLHVMNNNRNERRKTNIVSLHLAINNELFGLHNDDQRKITYAFSS